MEGKEKKQRRLFLIYTLILLGFFLLNTRVLYLAIIPSESMEPTIKVGNLVVGTRGDNKSIERYDIAIFKSPDDESRTLIKRVIGLPGETIEIKNGYVYADGVKLKESFVNELSSDDGIYKVPEDCYFMMGDNRNDSWDARYWSNTYVTKDKILGKALFTYWPFAHFGKLE